MDDIKFVKKEKWWNVKIATVRNISQEMSKVLLPYEKNPQNNFILYKFRTRYCHFQILITKHSITPIRCTCIAWHTKKSNKRSKWCYNSKQTDFSDKILPIKQGQNAAEMFVESKTKTPIRLTEKQTQTKTNEAHRNRWLWWLERLAVTKHCKDSSCVVFQHGFHTEDGHVIQDSRSSSRFITRQTHRPKFTSRSHSCSDFRINGWTCQKNTH